MVPKWDALFAASLVAERAFLFGFGETTYPLVVRKVFKAMNLVWTRALIRGWRFTTWGGPFLVRQLAPGRA